MQNRRSHFQQHPDFHITSSTILASTLRITRLNTRNPAGPVNPDLAFGPVLGAGVDNSMPRNSAPGEQQPPNSNENPDRLGNPLDIGGQPQAEAGGAASSFSSLLLWILGGASSESLNSFLSIFRDLRDQGQVYAEPSQQDNHTAQNNNG